MVEIRLSRAANWTRGRRSRWDCRNLHQGCNQYFFLICGFSFFGADDVHGPPLIWGWFPVRASVVDVFRVLRLLQAMMTQSDEKSMREAFVTKSAFETNPGQMEVTTHHGVRIAEVANMNRLAPQPHFEVAARV